MITQAISHRWSIMTYSNNQSTKTYASPREIFAWAMFDFANSGYTTVVSTTVFNAYFVGVIAAGTGHTGSSTLLWTVAVAVSNALIVLSAPLLGSIADYSGAKKMFLAVSTIGCIGFTALLSLTGPGMVAMAMLFIVAANFWYGTGENLIAAFLPEIAPSNKMGRISAFGWSVGYLGGLTSLGLCLAYVFWAQRNGQTASQFVPVTMLIVAVVFALATLPTFLWLKERAAPKKVPPGKTYLQIGLHRLHQTLSQALRFQDLLCFLSALLFLNCGTSTIVVLAAVYANQAMGFTTSDTIILMLAVNISALLGALSFGHLQDKVGSVRTITITLVLWIIAILLASSAEARTVFWVAANLMGVAMGACQSAGRALVGQFSPPDRSGEFFGLWGLVCKLAAIIGPLTYGGITYLNGGNHRQAILFTVTFFLVSLVLLTRVNEHRGKLAALSSLAQDNML